MVKVLHAFGDDIQIEKIADVHIAKGDVYFVTDQESYTVCKTKEQMETYIAKLETRFQELTIKHNKLIDILHPEEDVDG